MPRERLKDRRSRFSKTFLTIALTIHKWALFPFEPNKMGRKGPLYNMDQLNATTRFYRARRLTNMPRVSLTDRRSRFSKKFWANDPNNL